MQPADTLVDAEIRVALQPLHCTTCQRPIQPGENVAITVTSENRTETQETLTATFLCTDCAQ